MKHGLQNWFITFPTSNGQTRASSRNAMLGWSTRESWIARIPTIRSWRTATDTSKSLTVTQKRQSGASLLVLDLALNKILVGIQTAPLWDFHPMHGFPSIGWKSIHTGQNSNQLDGNPTIVPILPRCSGALSIELNIITNSRELNVTNSLCCFFLHIFCTGFSMIDKW